MHNTCITSTIALRTRGTLSFTFNDYAIERSPSGYSSSATYSCCCCANYSYKFPIGPSYCYNLYGLRQSSLIQWSPCRKLVSGGVDRFYSTRLPFRDVESSCSCDGGLSFRQTGLGGRKGLLRKCRVFEERSENCDIGDVEDTEILLSLLTEDFSEDCLRASKVTRRLVKKPVVEERENGEVSKKSRSKKKRVDLGVLETEPRHRHGGSLVSPGKKGNMREEVMWRQEEKGASVRQESRKTRLKKEHGDALLRNETGRRKEESVALKGNENEKRKSRLREDDWKVSSRTEESEDLSRREEHRQNVRREGSSCSSYYSLSSTGDFESDNDVEAREGRYLGEFSSNAIVNREAGKEEEHMQEEYREDHGVISAKKSTQNVNIVGSSVEAGLRKKSEKKLADASVQELELKEEASQKKSKLFMGHESIYKQEMNFRDDRQESTKFDEERKQQHRQQTGNEFSRQSETRMKQKQLVEMQDSHADDIHSYGSQKIYSGKGELSSKVKSLSQQTVGDHQRAIGVCSTEDKYQRNSVQVAKISELQDIDIRKTSISQQKFESSVNEEDYSINIHSTINDAAKQKQYDQVSGLVESGQQTQQLTKKEGKSILKKVSAERMRQEKNVNLGSSSESKITRRDDYQKGNDNLTKITFSRSGDSGKIDVEGRKKTMPDIQEGIAPKLQESGVLSQRSSVGIATPEVTDESLQVASTSPHRLELETSPMLHHETYGEVNISPQGQPSKLVPPEDTTIESAALLEKSSTDYVGEFINQVRGEIMSSEIQKEKITEFVQEEEQHHQHNLVQYSSGDSQSQGHESRSDSRQSGTKGPSDEMWNVDEPSLQESSRIEDQDAASKAGKSIDKRTGRSLWNIISDIALLRWSPRSESHSSGRKTGGRSSPNQSTSSETWFSGHEAAENEEVIEEKEQKSITIGQTGSNQEEKTHSQVEDGSSSSTVAGYLKHGRIDVPSSSNAQELQPTRTSLHSAGIPEGMPTTAMAESSIPLLTFQQQISPALPGVSSKAEEAKASDGGMKEKLNTGSIVKAESAVDEGELSLRRKKIQRQDQVIKDRFDEWEDAYRLEAEQRKVDEKFMWEALLEAQNAADNWEVPVGAVLVHKGKIIARGFNKVEELRDSTAHAEMICIREASNMLRTWRLSETTLYVTLEPCPMCAGAILQARIDTVVWGAPNKLLGADGSWIRLFPDGDGGNNMELSNKPPAPVHPFHPKILVRRGVLAAECADAMQQFFKLRRKDKKPDPSPTPTTGPHVSHRPFKFLARMHDAFNVMFCL